LSVVAFLAWIPFLKYDEVPEGHWFISAKGKKSAEATAVFAVIVTLSGILFNEYVLNFEILLAPVPAFISNGILPLLILLGFMAAYHKYYLKNFSLSKQELVQAVFVFVIMAFIVLTLVGIFFRGKDMALTFPWNI
jgi:hypothetical protein